MKKPVLKRYPDSGSVDASKAEDDPKPIQTAPVKLAQRGVGGVYVNLGKGKIAKA
jgi:hypothetical protein